jgi:hypothetical protein
MKSAPRPRRRIATWQVVAAIAAVAVVAALIALFATRAGGGNDKPATVAAGTPVRLASEDWIVTVTSAQRVAGAAPEMGIAQPPSGVYVVVAFDAENTARQVHPLTTLKLQLKDSQGRTHDLAIGPSVAYGPARNGTSYGLPVEAGQRASSGVVFDVPPDATGFTLIGAGGLQVTLGDAGTAVR